MESTPSSSRWLTLISSHLIRATPARAILAILATLVSQFSLMLGMLLPIKVIMLLGAESVPSYMPAPINSMSLESATILLAITSVCFVVGYAITDRLANKWINSACDHVVRDTGKVILFENQDDIAKTSYLKIVNAQASLIYVLLVLLGLAVIYPKLCLALLIFVLFCAPFAYKNYKKSTIEESPKQFIQLVHSLSNISFVAVFCLVIVDHLYLSPPPILLTIIAVILSRQGATKFCSLIIDTSTILRDREKISAIFLQNHVLLPRQSANHQALANFLSLEYRESWLVEALTKAGWESSATNSYRTAWLQTTVPNVFALWVKSDQSNLACIVKIFDSTKKSHALHEASLLTCINADALPAPKLCFSGVIDDFHIHVLDCIDYIPLQSPEKFGELSDLAKKAIVTWPVPKQLQESYTKAHPVLWQKINRNMFDNLKIAATKEQWDDIEFVVKNLDTIKRALAELPLCLFNPNITPRTVLESENDLLVYQWGQWSIDTLGASFPATTPGIKQIQELTQTSETQSFEVHPVWAEVSCYLSDIEKHIKNQRYIDVFERLPELKSRLNIVLNE